MCNATEPSHPALCHAATAGAAAALVPISQCHPLLPAQGAGAQHELQHNLLHRHPHLTAQFLTGNVALPERKQLNRKSSLKKKKKKEKKDCSFLLNSKHYRKNTFTQVKQCPELHQGSTGCSSAALLLEQPAIIQQRILSDA